jgi:hypothetical protein
LVGRETHIFYRIITQCCIHSLLKCPDEEGWTGVVSPPEIGLHAFDQSSWIFIVLSYLETIGKSMSSSQFRNN